MLTDRQKYTYFLSLDGGTNYTQFYPVRGIKLEDKRQDNEIFYRTFCREDIVISRNYRNSAGSYANLSLFDSLVLQFYDRTKLSDEIKIRVKNNFTGTAVTKWDGYFTISNCKLDFDGGVIGFTPQPDDNYRYLIKYGDIEIDITDITTVTENLVTISAVSTEEVCYSEDMDTTACSDLDDGDWAYCVGGDINYADDPEIYLEYGLDPSVNYKTHKRQRIPFEPMPNTGWYEANGFWYLDSCTTQTVTMEIYGFYHLYQLVEGILDTIRDDNAELPDYTLWSQFILNSDSPPMRNYVTGEIPNPIRYLQISQKSNVRLINPTNLATEANLTFNQLMTIYKEMFDAWWFIDSLGYLRIEHRKYFEWGLSWLSDQFTPDIDLTDSTYYTQLYQLNLQNFSYPDIDYNYEQWQYMEAGSAWFRKEETTIEYGYALEKRTPLTHDLSNVTVDIQYIFDMPDKVSDEGFVIASCDSTLTVLNEIIVNSGNATPRMNGHLSIPNLIYNYHTRGRLCLTGTIDGDATTFVTEQKLRKGKMVVFSINESDIDEINPYRSKRIKFVTPNYTISTQDGEIESAVHDLEDDVVEMTLLFSNTAFSTETYNIMINDTDAVLADVDDTLIYT